VNWIWSNFKCALYVAFQEVNFLNTNNISLWGGGGWGVLKTLEGRAW
jgi:hypothetical protein